MFDDKWATVPNFELPVVLQQNSCLSLVAEYWNSEFKDILWTGSGFLI